MPCFLTDEQRDELDLSLLEERLDMHRRAWEALVNGTPSGYRLAKPQKARYNHDLYHCDVIVEAIGGPVIFGIGPTPEDAVLDAVVKCEATR